MSRLHGGHAGLLEHVARISKTVEVPSSKAEPGPGCLHITWDEGCDPSESGAERHSGDPRQAPSSVSRQSVPVVKVSSPKNPSAIRQFLRHRRKQSCDPVVEQAVHDHAPRQRHLSAKSQKAANLQFRPSQHALVSSLFCRRYGIAVDQESVILGIESRVNELDDLRDELRIPVAEMQDGRLSVHVPGGLRPSAG